MLRLRAAVGIERHVAAALQPLLGVPLGQAVPHVIDDGHEVSGRAYSFATAMSGASGCFMPTM